ncbi:MAG: PqqD family peptide modification chaperone [Cyanobacteria bacterium P01_F01_bin.116]
MTTITLDTVFQRVQTVMESKVGDESMMMDIDKGMYYALNPVSSRIWALLEQPLSAKAVCDHLLEEYAVEPSVCEQ